MRRRVTELNERRRAEERPTTLVYLGLHIGEVFYGNIGSVDRLDFTVVGPAVNEASRIASMCRSVDRAGADLFGLRRGAARTEARSAGLGGALRLAWSRPRAGAFHHRSGIALAPSLAPQIGTASRRADSPGKIPPHGLQPFLPDAYDDGKSKAVQRGSHVLGGKHGEYEAS